MSSYAVDLEEGLTVATCHLSHNVRLYSNGNEADQRKGKCDMPNIRVALKKREYVEYFVSSMIEVSEKELSQIQNRPLQAKYWAENVAVYRIDKDAWSALDDGRKTFSVEAIEVEVAPVAKPA